jgi:hypothetical protein
MKTMAIHNMLTISDAAKQFGVSRQRMHVLLKTYAVRTQAIGPLKLVEKKELRKIPVIRPTGRKLKSFA